MRCPSCGADILGGFKFCPSCGKPVAPATCPGCGSMVKADTNFCTTCGSSLKNPGSAAPPPPPLPPAPAQAPAGIASDLRDILPGEVVLMDTGHFPMTHVKNLMSSVNGKLYLTNQRLIFKAGKLQGVGGVMAGDLFIPNMKDANKSKEYFTIPLNEVSAVEKGWATLTVHANKTYKFGGMRSTDAWAAAINKAIK